MNVAIITPMPEEKIKLKSILGNIHEQRTANALVTHGDYLNHHIFLVETGIGKVAAAIGTAVVLIRFQIDILVNTGSAGALVDSLKIGDVVIGEKIAYFDVDVTAFGYKLGQLPNEPLYFESDTELIKQFRALISNTQSGVILSGDSFVKEIKQIPSKLLESQPLAVEMESGAIAQTAKSFGVPFIILRGISDLADHSSSIDFEKFVEQAGEKSANILIEFLNNSRTKSK